MRNNLYPIFLKTGSLQILVVGGGFVALEKLEFLFKSSPDATVSLVAPFIRPETRAFVKDKAVHIIEDHYRPQYLSKKHLVIATTDQPETNLEVYTDCRSQHILVNVADNPPLCDFYMGGIVTKGNLKIGISTNGKSPTLAKRMREWLETILPEEIDQLLDYLQQYRATVKGDFKDKIIAMNAATKKMISHD